ncbi:acyl carrier protein [Moheibacter lacus]|uniref:Acyl carrier protein n=1 Tax=Moheibacter lacus TaxID=2745851 RepID=A0A838ZK61_9FLAO|nr:acyl carrier protein [Moheibacter lacus]MBA5628764.1 acyl carrier protein [Moheibacter lacus]
MNRATIIQTINDFLVEEFEVDASTISPTANMKETLDLDSLDYVDLVVIIESNFGVKLEGKDFQNIHTFDDLYEIVDQKFHTIA